MDQNDEAVKKQPANFILIGAMASGKTTMGWLLSKYIGYGFVDLDQYIEKKEKTTVAEIFQNKGESQFRKMETTYLKELSSIRSHVFSLGGGAVIDDENWDLVCGMGEVIWLDTPPEEIARRIVADSAELEKRPLLKEVMSEKDRSMRQKLLKERVSALIGQRLGRYREAQIHFTDQYSTPESSVAALKELLCEKGYIKSANAAPLDKWQTL